MLKWTCAIGNEEVGEIGIHNNIYFTSGLVFANMSATTTHAAFVKILTQWYMEEVFVFAWAIGSHVELCCEFFSETIVVGNEVNSLTKEQRSFF